MEKILVPVDGSVNSDKALRFAVEMAEESGCMLVLLNVVHSPVLMYPEDPFVAAKVIRPLEDRGKEILNDAEAYAASHGVTIKKRLEYGDPAIRIIEIIEQEGVTLVVMGKRDLNPVKSFFIGSVSNQVLQHANCSVRVVR